jgi:hypothetical protein
MKTGTCQRCGLEQRTLTRNGSLRICSDCEQHVHYERVQAPQVVWTQRLARAAMALVFSLVAVR